MSTASGSSRSATPASAAGRARSHRKLWLITGLVLIAGPAFYAILFTLYWPFTKQALIDVLQERSQRSVTIDHFHNTYFPPGGVAEGIKFWRYRHKNESPLITIQKITVSVTFPTLLTFQHRLDNLRVAGLHLIVPANEPPGDPSPMELLTSTSSKSSLPVEHLEASNAVLDYLVGSNAHPLRITVNTLRALHVSSKTAMPYSIELSNSEIPGVIQSQGTFGPVNLKQSAETPVRGRFSYQHGNLASIPGIAGTLFADANYSGQLSDVIVTGTATVRNFAVKGSSYTRNMAVHYEFSVNATNGDVGLKKVITDFEQTRILFTGSIRAAKKGDIASIDLSSQHARVQDLLDLFITGKPCMTGDVALNGQFTLPAGYQSFLDDMTLTGNFGIAQGKFTDESTEAGLTKLSQTSRAAKREESQPDPATVLSDLAGHADITRGVAHLSHVEFRIPGARARVAGTYSLLTYKADLSGTLLTSGNVSDTQTGIKSLFLKALTPFFKRHKHAKIIPFKITGPYGHTTVSLDLGRNVEKISS